MCPAAGRLGSCNLNRFLEFLAEVFDAGLQYRTVNVYRSAISVSYLDVFWEVIL